MSNTTTPERRYAAEHRTGGVWRQGRVTDAMTAMEEAYGFSRRGLRPVRIVDVETGESFSTGELLRSIDLAPARTELAECAHLAIADQDRLVCTHCGVELSLL